MVVSIQSFYGDALPRPFIVLGVAKRTDAPHVNDALLEWAKDAPFRAGGLNFQRSRYMGKIEGKMKQKHGLETTKFDALDESEMDDDETSPGRTARSNGSVRRAPKTKPARRGAFGNLKRKVGGNDRSKKSSERAKGRKEDPRKSVAGNNTTAQTTKSTSRRGEKNSRDSAKDKGPQSAFTRLLQREKSKKAGITGRQRGTRGSTKALDNTVALTAAAAAAATKRSRSKSNTFDFPADSEDEENASPKLRRLSRS